MNKISYSTAALERTLRHTHFYTRLVFSGNSGREGGMNEVTAVGLRLAGGRHKVGDSVLSWR